MSFITGKLYKRYSNIEKKIVIHTSYRDSYFVIKGLLLSDQVETAKDMILNFFDFVETYGFIRK